MSQRHTRSTTNMELWVYTCEIAATSTAIKSSFLQCGNYLLKINQITQTTLHSESNELLFMHDKKLIITHIKIIKFIFTSRRNLHKLQKEARKPTKGSQVFNFTLDYRL